jgi:alkanesulfonate monooxygenase SsuD/methylene tetrahydromethanopterin reductase-like flavin-dependent oxidoreductase (luciferase family)
MSWCSSAARLSSAAPAPRAEEKYREYHRHASVEGALAHFSGSTGIRSSRSGSARPFRSATGRCVDAITRLSSNRWTKRRIIGQMVLLGSRNSPTVGSAVEVADELIGWGEDSDIDGFNLSRIVTPESLRDFIDLVVPILQERGGYKRDYRPGPARCATSCSAMHGFRPRTQQPRIGGLPQVQNSRGAKLGVFA